MLIVKHIRCEAPRHGLLFVNSPQTSLNTLIHLFLFGNVFVCPFSAPPWRASLSLYTTVLHCHRIGTTVVSHPVKVQEMKKCCGGLELVIQLDEKVSRH